MALLARYLTPERVAFLRNRTRDGAVRELVTRLKARAEPPAIWWARGDPMRAGAPFGAGRLDRG